MKYTDISKATVRRQVRAKPEPYTYRLGAGQHLTFRKNSGGHIAWGARLTTKGKKEFTAFDNIGPT